MYSVYIIAAKVLLFGIIIATTKVRLAEVQAKIDAASLKMVDAREKIDAAKERGLSQVSTTTGAWLTPSPSWVVDSAGSPYVSGGVTYDAGKALDGDVDSYYWNPYHGTGHGYNNWFIVLDLTERYTLTRIAVNNFGDTVHDAAAFKLQASQVGSPYSWDDGVSVSDVAGGTDRRQEFGGFQGTARYWKFVITRTHSNWQPYLKGLNLFGVGSGVKDASCSEVKSFNSASVDGEYILHPFLTCKDASVRVYCHDMASGNPKEFLSLPSGPENNYAIVFPDRLDTAYVGQCNGPLQAPYEEDGTTKFRKVRIQFEKTAAQVLRNDYTFATTTGNHDIGYGQAGDCYSWQQGCAKGMFKVNLTGTDLALAPGARWIFDRYPPHLTMDDMFISEDRKIASARCGGWCGNCWPDDETFYLSHPQCTGQTQVVKALVGQDAILDCDYDQNTDGNLITVTWTVAIGGSSVNLYIKTSGSADNQITPPAEYVGRMELDGDGNLKLTNVTIEDERQYTCTTTASINSETTVVSLQSFVQPQTPTMSLTPTMDKAAVPVGTNLTLTCSSTGGRPPADLAWTVAKNGGAATTVPVTSNTTTVNANGVGDTTATIDVTIPDDKGAMIVYTCTSSGPDPITQDSETVTLTVESGTSGGLSTGAIVGIAVGVPVGVALIVGTVVLVVKKPCSK